jgi:glycosyltransferase involved in cell wall biosynthesis
MEARSRPELISVVMPVRNCEAHLGDQLAALAEQTYAGDWELVVVDNGCEDASLAIVDSWRDRLPAIRIADASDRRGLNYARNVGVAAARGDFLAFCDADDVAEPGWLAGLAAHATDADAVGGGVCLETLNDEIRQAWQPSDGLTELLECYGYMPHTTGGNVGIWADVAREVGWDEGFEFGGSDIEFAWRMQLSGYRAVFAPDAVMRLRYRPSVRGLAWQYFRYGASEPHLYRRFRAHGMPPSDTDAVRAKWRWLVDNVHLLRTEDGRGNWVRILAGGAGRICGSLRWRVLYL